MLAEVTTDHLPDAANCRSITAKYLVFQLQKDFFFFAFFFLSDFQCDFDSVSYSQNLNYI